MSQSASTSERRSVPEERREGPKALGSRDNFWGQEQDEPDRQMGHTETNGTDPAEFIAFQHLLDFVSPICERTKEKNDREVELSEPNLYLPKQHDTGSRIIEYRQHRHRRRVNPETGWINWGETTSTGLPEVSQEVYIQAVHNYLADRLEDTTQDEGDILITRIDDYLQRAKRLFNDQNHNSLDAFATFVRQVRNGEIVSN